MTRTREYYDGFSDRYDASRNSAYFRFVRGEELRIIQRHTTGKTVLEVGCGTGTLLQTVASAAREAVGVDISHEMLVHARRKGLLVSQADACRLPFGDAMFDVTYSMKVLPHVEDIDAALDEIARVTRPGGNIILQFYGAHSLKCATNRLCGSPIYQRHDTVEQMLDRIPQSCRYVELYGIRIVACCARLFEIPLVRSLTVGIERLAARSALRRLAGYVVVVAEKQS